MLIILAAGLGWLIFGDLEGAIFAAIGTYVALFVIGAWYE